MENKLFKNTRHKFQLPEQISSHRFSEASTRAIFAEMGYPSDSRITIQDIDLMLLPEGIINIRNLRSKVGAK